MANPKTIKKRRAEMKKLCKDCARNPETCEYFQLREYKNLCLWRQPK